ncbi:hypothetical protein Tco_1220255 [Tanacetum coccineum]
MGTVIFVHGMRNLENGWLIMREGSCLFRMEFSVGGRRLVWDTVKVPSFYNLTVAKGQKEDPTPVVMELLYLLKEKHFVVLVRGQGCHNLSLLSVRKWALIVSLAIDVSDISLISSNLRWMDSTINLVLLL